MEQNEERDSFFSQLLEDTHKHTHTKSMSDRWGSGPSGPLNKKLLERPAGCKILLADI